MRCESIRLLVRHCPAKSTFPGSDDKSRLVGTPTIRETDWFGFVPGDYQDASQAKFPLRLIIERNTTV